MESLTEFSIEELIGKQQWNRIRELLSTWKVPDLVDLLTDLDKPDRVLIFRLLRGLRPDDTASLLEELESAIALAFSYHLSSQAAEMPALKQMLQAC